MELELSQLEIGGGTQPRVEINEDTVSDYAEALNNGDDFPPVVVFHDGTHYWLADGFHRYHAHRRAGHQQIEADVRKGTLREAILHSVGANADHGLRRTAKDKRNAVVTMLTNDVVVTDGQGNPWSDREIARRCAVSPDTVGRIRRELSLSDSDSDARTYRTKHGTQSVMTTANIRRANRRRAKSNGTHARNAFRAQRGFHNENGPVPMRAISLPLNNPQQAARSMVSVYGDAYIKDLLHELQRYFKEPTHDRN